MKSLLRKILRWSKPTRLPIVSGDDLKEFLESSGYYDSLQVGELKCINCSRTMTLDNIAVMRVDQGKLEFFCDSSTCIAEINSISFQPEEATND